MKGSALSTYRIQLTGDFQFQDAEKSLNYFKHLGISHLYLSPIMEAAEGSRHFYDTFDFTHISKALGGEDSFRTFSRTARRKGIRIILDIVPNHMTILNRFMIDFLMNGKQSAYRTLFDIDLSYGDFPGRIILPLLDFYPFEHEDRFTLTDDSILANGGSLKLPRRRSDGKSRDVMSTLNNQAYVLTHWKEAARMINYRRFFAVNGLIAIKMESNKNFALFHSKIKELIDDDMIQGLRVDHIDGLYYPAAYLRRLHSILGDRPVWVEKVLARDENLDSAWPVEGDTGYAARSRINSVFLDPGKLADLRLLFGQFGGDRYEGESYRVNLKVETANRLFRADIRKYSGMIFHFLESKGCTGVSKDAIADALTSVIACMNQYRTYSSFRNSEYSKWIEFARIASVQFPGLENEINAFIVFLRYTDKDGKALNTLRKIEQFTGSIMAKSMEDCYFYRYSALLSTCLVGSMPYEQPYKDDEIHSFFFNIQKTGRRPMITLSTHDTKFGEDAIARFNSIQDFTIEWKNMLRFLSTSAAIKDYDVYRIVQVIAGTSDPSDHEYSTRLHSYIVKALRESRENTNWEHPSLAYEEACVKFATYALSELRNKFSDLLYSVTYFGSLNSMSQTILKFMLPGTPDTYQGSEVFNLSFVDPDNRRPVDFSSLSERLSRLENRVKTETLPLDMDKLMSGEFKLFLTWKLLSIRDKVSSYLIHGNYKPLEFSGRMRDHLFGFMYSLKGSSLLVVVTRHHRSFMTDRRYDNSCWDGTNIDNVPGMGNKISDLLCDRFLHGMDLTSILGLYPFAVLEVA